MTSYIIDASVYAPLIIAYGRPLIEKLRKVKFIVLDLTIYEVCNAFWKECLKLRRMREDETLIACKVAKSLLRYVTLYKVTDLDVEEVIRIAIENNITFYDSSYIALACKLKSPIASEDRDIIDVAPRYGIEVIRLNQLLDILKQV